MVFRRRNCTLVCCKFRGVGGVIARRAGARFDASDAKLHVGSLQVVMMVLESLNRYASLVLSISGHSCVIFLRSFFVNFLVGSGIILCFSLQ